MVSTKQLLLFRETLNTSKIGKNLRKKCNISLAYRIFEYLSFCLMDSVASFTYFDFQIEDILIWQYQHIQS